MKVKKSIIMLILVIFLFSLTSVCAAEMDDVIASDDTDQIEVSSNDKIGEDNLQKSEENVALGESDDSATDVSLKSSDGDELSSSGEFGELQKLIDNASDKDVINLERNYTYTIGTDTITEGIIITKNLTINGNGFTIDAQGKSRILNIESGINVVLNNIIFTNGFTAGNGGAIMASGNVDIVGSRFINNTAVDGGAIESFNAKMTISESYFTSNNATEYGGAIYNFNSDVKLNDVYFTGNNATVYGGAIYNFAGNVNVTKSRFTRNAAGSNGGAVLNSFGTLNIFETCFSQNTAVNGGAVYMDSGSVDDCNFINNTADYGGAVYFSSAGEVSKCTFINNTAFDEGGAVYFKSTGKVLNSNFTANTAVIYAGAVYFSTMGVVSNSNFINNSADNYAGAVFIEYDGNVSDCNFTANKANGINGDAGAVYFYRTGNLLNCNFNANEVTGLFGHGGAVFITYDGNVTNCNFTDNKANGECDGGGAIGVYANITVSDCRFTGNEAEMGSAIYFDYADGHAYTRNISHSIFLNNKANADYDAPFNITVNGNNLEIRFVGNDNILNAIFSRGDVEINITNVTYWGVEGITNTGEDTIVPVITDAEAGVNITVKGVVNGVDINKVKTTDAEGKIVLENVSDYYITVSHEEDSYYTSAEMLFTNRQLSLNVTDITTTNKTVNITAKSEILGDVMLCEVYFNVDGNFIKANYAGNGTWWALHTFDDYGTYLVNASFNGEYNVIISNGTVTVNKIKTEITGSAITTTYNVNKNLIITLKDSTGKALSGVNVTVDLNGAKTYITDSNGQVIVTTKGLASKVYTAKVTFSGNTNYDKSTKDIKVTVNKAANPLKVKAKTVKVKFSKLKKKAQKLKVTKVVKFTKKGQGTLTYKKVKGNKKITINKKTGKVTIKKGLKKGTYKVKMKIKAKGNSNYKASAFKTITFKIKVK